MAKAAKDATRSFAFFAKKTAAKFPANGGGEDGDNAAFQEAQAAAAEVIRKLTKDVQAAHKVAEETAERLRKIAEEAVALVHRTADEAGAMIEKALEEAEDKVLGAAEQAASALPGGGDVEFFDPKSLKGKLRGRP